MAAGLNSAALHIGGAAIATAVAFVQIHTATPSSGGSNEATSARQAVTLTDTAGVISGGPVSFTGGAASGPAVALGYWSASSGGTFYGYDLLTGDQTFNAAGQYTVDTITLTGSST